MSSIDTIAVFDVGKTNKKLLVFDGQYRLLHEESRQFAEATDEDGFPCEDLPALTQWVKDMFVAVNVDKRFRIRAVNFSGYGASFVHLDRQQQVIGPLYNYLKPFPANLQKQFYNDHGGESRLSKQTASPVLGSLNSGLQLYRLKYEQPERFNTLAWALHLPQYLSFILTGIAFSDITSIGCHTHLWDFKAMQYHDWVKEEGLLEKLAPLIASDSVAAENADGQKIGVGLHDSSAALIPYLLSFKEPFVLLSTGTWCISLNPFNHSQLSDMELHNDCLSYLSYKGEAVKASRLFAGYEHEQQVKRLADHFNKAVDYYKTVVYDAKYIRKNNEAGFRQEAAGTAMLRASKFEQRELSVFPTYEEAYHQFIRDIIDQQVYSTSLVTSGTRVKRIFVDGGFSNNTVYMQLLASAFPGQEVYAASVPQASALGAAMAMHHHWSKGVLPPDIITLKFYSGKQ